MVEDFLSEALFSQKEKDINTWQKKKQQQQNNNIYVKIEILSSIFVKD